MRHKREGEIITPGEVKRIFKDHGIVASAVRACDVFNTFRISNRTFYTMRNYGHFHEVAPRLYDTEELITFFCQNPRFLVARQRA